MRILVLEDEPHTLHALAALLRREGHDVTESSSALDAVAQLALHSFDLCLIDYELGTSLTGLDVGKHARMRYPGIALIMVSGYDPDEMRPKLEDPLQPFLVVLGKPWEAAELLAHVAAVARRLEDTKP